MPSLSVWLVRLALLYLSAGATLGGLLLVAKAWPFWARVWPLRPLHVEWLLFGWMVQLACGVAFWILPRTPARAGTRAVLLALVLLNAGLWVAGLAQIMGHPGCLLLGRTLEAGAVAAFACHLWPRARALRR